MQLVLISGLSGSGKSIALNVLEDAATTASTTFRRSCSASDRLPAPRRPRARRGEHRRPQRRLARGAARVDPRAEGAQGVDLRLLFLDAEERHADQALLRDAPAPPARGARRAPLDECLTPRARAPRRGRRDRPSPRHVRPAPNTLRNWIKDLLDIDAAGSCSLFESFSYKQGIPLDADLVFDVRCLPNPYYDPQLRPLTGLDAPSSPSSRRSPRRGAMFEDIGASSRRWLPAFVRGQPRAPSPSRIGCTGGRHRSVYFVERLGAYFRSRAPVLVRHRHLAAAMTAAPLTVALTGASGMPYGLRLVESAHRAKARVYLAVLAGGARGREAGDGDRAAAARRGRGAHVQRALLGASAASCAYSAARTGLRPSPRAPTRPTPW